ncbi:MAG: hypothetical protein JXR43_09110 [Burkholderiaceae bacterium]|nr:hypothetical protein [Burkholderiaceae bacterium]
MDHSTVHIDAHILLGEEPMNWRLAALVDIEAVQALAPVTSHQLPAQPGRFGAARKSGWSCGDAPYLTWFDPDDRYPPQMAASFLHQAATLLEQNPATACCCSAEQQITSQGRLLGFPCIYTPDLSAVRTRPSALHGLLLWRRIVVEALAGSIDDADPIAEWTLLLAAIDAGHAYHRLPITARHWRRHCGQSHRALSLPA